MRKSLQFIVIRSSLACLLYASFLATSSLFAFDILSNMDLEYNIVKSSV